MPAPPPVENDAAEPAPGPRLVEVFEDWWPPDVREGLAGVEAGEGSP